MIISPADLSSTRRRIGIRQPSARRVPSSMVVQSFGGFNLLLLVLALLFSGCASSPAYKTLYAVGHATDAAIGAYYDGVVRGLIRTNGVPEISRKYKRFQAAYSLALDVAQFNPKVKPTPEISSMSLEITKAIENERGRK